VLNRLFPLIVPIIAFSVVIALIIGIGELLLASGTTGAVPLALALTLLVVAIAAMFSYRASKLPPVKWPDPRSWEEPARKTDLGASYLIGQFVVLFGIGLILLFVILALK
jgi:hypothetical protein